MKILVNHSEITLKGKNRPFFEKALADNIRHSLGNTTIQNLYGRFLIATPSRLNLEVENKLRNAFGIANFSFVTEIKPDRDTLRINLIRALSGKSFMTFALRISRADKTLPFSSRQLTDDIGDDIRIKLEKKVDLTDPDLTVFIDCYRDFFLYYFEKYEGCRGLPVGTGGRVLALLSGGIDSPVAAYLMAKRGCTVDLLHFHAFADNEYAKKSKIVETGNLLNRYSLYSNLFLVPYMPFQIALLGIKTDNELILFRRFMLRVGEEMARRSGYQALVTGDNLGQVASQTIENLSVTEQAVSIPVFRPLLTYNKEEIINLARTIGTYDLSTVPYKDCCSIIEKHPKTKSRIEELVAGEKKLPMEKLIRETINSSVKV